MTVTEHSEAWKVYGVQEPPTDVVRHAIRAVSVLQSFLPDGYEATVVVNQIRPVTAEPHFLVVSNDGLPLVAHRIRQSEPLGQYRRLGSWK